MNDIIESSVLNSDLSDRRITLNLTFSTPEDITVRSCEVLGKGFRNRISFNEYKRVEDVLTARLARAVKSCLERLPDGAHVLSLPEFLVELPGLVLSGVHIMVMKSNEGMRNAILRFKDFMGAINNAFCFDIGFHEPVANHGEKLAINVLADVCLPILDLCRVFNDLGLIDDNHRQKNIADRAREFQFQTELLKRYIANAGMARRIDGEFVLNSAPRPCDRHISRS